MVTTLFAQIGCAFFMTIAREGCWMRFLDKHDYYTLVDVTEELCLMSPVIFRSMAFLQGIIGVFNQLVAVTQNWSNYRDYNDTDAAEKVHAQATGRTA
jgi:hypothetical protein